MSWRSISTRPTETSHASGARCLGRVPQALETPWPLGPLDCCLIVDRVVHNYMFVARLFACFRLSYAVSVLRTTPFKKVCNQLVKMMLCSKAASLFYNYFAWSIHPPSPVSMFGTGGRRAFSNHRCSVDYAYNSCQVYFWPLSGRTRGPGRPRL